jgi:hypothetical protein
MGTAYKIPDNGSTFGNLYGIAYKHTNNGVGGTMAGGHQIVFANNGLPGTAIGLAGGIWTNGDISINGKIINQSPISLPLYGGWTFYGSPFAPPTYWKDKNGVVHLEGLLRAGTTTGGTVVAQLPGGYRPSHNLIFTVNTSSGVTRLDVKNSASYGRIIIPYTESMSYLSLDGISFKAEY